MTLNGYKYYYYVSKNGGLHSNIYILCYKHIVFLRKYSLFAFIILIFYYRLFFIISKLQFYIDYYDIYVAMKFHSNIL